MLDGRVASSHPFDHRVRFGSRLTDLDADPYLVALRLCGALLRVPDAGLPAWAGTDDDGTSMLVPHLEGTSRRVYVHAPFGVVERPRREDVVPLSWYPGYVQALERDVPAWLDGLSEVPSWVHQTVLARVNEIMEADRWLRFPAAGLTEAERSRVAVMLRSVLEQVPASEVEAYCATPMALNRRAALLAATGGAMPGPVLPSDRPFWDERKVSYFVAGQVPQERWEVDGVEVTPSCGKLVAHSYFDDVFVHERLVWLPRDIEGGLRFRIIGYLQNFFDVSLMALGRDRAGINVATLVEYGTTDGRAIQLQEVGFGRSVATELLADHADALHFSADDELEEFDYEAVLASTALSDEARAEIENIMVKVQVDDAPA